MIFTSDVQREAQLWLTAFSQFKPVAVLKELDCSVHTSSMGALLPPFHTKFMSSEMIEQLFRVYWHLYSNFDPLAFNTLLPVGLQLQARSYILHLLELTKVQDTRHKKSSEDSESRAF